jgi:hypothetical protein
MTISNIRRIGNSIAFNFSDFGSTTKLIILPLHLTTFQISQTELLIQPPTLWRTCHWEHTFTDSNERDLVILEISEILCNASSPPRIRLDMPTPDRFTELK